MTMIDTDTMDGVFQADSSWVGMVREDVSALLAASFPVKPPRGWFGNPNFEAVNPLTISNDGRVAGHIATWKQSHIGLAGSVKAPRSRSGYAFFATGVLECDDGSHVDVGQITLSGGHAPLEASVADAVAHYDNTASAVMDVAVGEDNHGIWVAGALRPNVDDIQLRSIRASSVSGDWRPINGGLELVAVCAVNVPGFPIPRARVASGQPVALIAAGTDELVRISVLDSFGLDLKSAVTAAVGAIDERLQSMENALLGRARDRRQAVDEAVRQHKQATTAAAAPVEPDPMVAALRERAYGDTSWQDGMDIALSTQECLVASLRSRVKNDEPLVATATKAWDAEKRKKASDKGEALPDGSYPIHDKTDWRKARQAIGRAKPEKRSRVVRHIKKRGRELGIDKDTVNAVGRS